MCHDVGLMLGRSGLLRLQTMTSSHISSWAPNIYRRRSSWTKTCGCGAFVISGRSLHSAMAPSVPDVSVAMLARNVAPQCCPAMLPWMLPWMLPCNIATLPRNVALQCCPAMLQCCPAMLPSMLPWMLQCCPAILQCCPAMLQCCPAIMPCNVAL